MAKMWEGWLMPKSRVGETAVKQHHPDGDYHHYHLLPVSYTTPGMIWSNSKCQGNQHHAENVMRCIICMTVNRQERGRADRILTSAINPKWLRNIYSASVCRRHQLIVSRVIKSVCEPSGNESQRQACASHNHGVKDAK